jgi:hypothetical protein
MQLELREKKYFDERATREMGRRICTQANARFRKA